MQAYLSFDRFGTLDGGVLAQAAGNQVEVLGFDGDAEGILIANDSCVDYWLLVTAGLAASPECACAATARRAIDDEGPGTTCSRGGVSMTPQGSDAPVVGQPGYGGICEGGVGEQGPTDETDESAASGEARPPPPPPGAPAFTRGPPDEDDEDDAADDRPPIVLPRIGVPVSVP